MLWNRETLCTKIVPSCPSSSLLPARPLRRCADAADTARGRFKPHRDEEALTVLVPLTDPGAFQGGGTCFWSVERAKQRLAAAFSTGRESGGGTTVPGDFVLLPPAGSALVFAGCVTHAAVAVTSGERCILVASFSPASPAGSDEFGECQQ